MQIGFFDRSISQVIERYITNLFSRAVLALTCKEGYRIYCDPNVTYKLNLLCGKVIDFQLLSILVKHYFNLLDNVTLVENPSLDIFPDTVGFILPIAGSDDEDLANWYLSLLEFYGEFRKSMWIDAVLFVMDNSQIPDYLSHLITPWSIDFSGGSIRLRYIGGKFIP